MRYIKKVKKDEEILDVALGKYANLRPAIELFDENGMLVTRVSVNLVDEIMEADEVAIDNISREYVSCLVSGKILMRPHRSITQDFPSWTVKYKVCRLDPSVIEKIS